jgi:diadenosine tetraphosphate (Ap4A) HIT family hydrolase
MNGEAFALHPNLEATSAFVADLELCQARLQLDARFPWLVLVPRLADVREIEELSPKDRATLIEEIAKACAAVRAMAAVMDRAVEKLNIGALGNVTPQLHVHVLGRWRSDGLWPNPVWGRGEPRAYEPEVLAEAIRTAAQALGGS